MLLGNSGFGVDREANHRTWVSSGKRVVLTLAGANGLKVFGELLRSAKCPLATVASPHLLTQKPAGGTLSSSAPEGL